MESGSLDVEKFDDAAIQRLGKIQDGIQQNRVLMLVSIVLSLAVYILSFWMMFIPRLRSMGQSPKLAWLMAVPIVNALFAWVLIFTPPKY